MWYVVQMRVGRLACRCYMRAGGYIVVAVRVFVFVNVSRGVTDSEQLNMINDAENVECT